MFKSSLKNEITSSISELPNRLSLISIIFILITLAIFSCKPTTTNEEKEPLVLDMVHHNPGLLNLPKQV